MTHGLFLSSTLSLIDLFDTQKESMNLIVNSFAFSPRHHVIQAEAVVNEYEKRNAK